MTLKEVLSLFASIINPEGQSNLKYICQLDCDFNHPYPSVTKGAVSIDKIKTKLNFEPSPIKEAFSETIEFFNEAYIKYPKHRKSIENEIKKEVIKNENDKLKFNEFILNFIELKTKNNN